MTLLMDEISQSNITSIFTLADLYTIGVKKEAAEEMLHEALMKNEIIHIKKDIYTLNRMFRKELISEDVLAQKLIPDSYVSMEFVLSEISWIPENVYIVTCSTKWKSINIPTQFGNYQYWHIPQKAYQAGLRRVTEGYNSYQKATPLKALADMVYKRGYDWTTLTPLHKSLRIEYDDLETLTAKDFDELHGKYEIQNVEKFLLGIRKELSL